MRDGGGSIPHCAIAGRLFATMRSASARMRVSRNTEKDPKATAITVISTKPNPMRWRMFVDFMRIFSISNATVKNP